MLERSTPNSRSTGSDQRRRRRTARLAAAIAAGALALGVGGAPASAETPAVQVVDAPASVATVVSVPGQALVIDDQGAVSGGTGFGSLSGVNLNRPISAAAATPSGQGYWLVVADGGVFTFGDALFRGSLGNLRLNQPIVGMAGAPDGAGYWLVASDGGVFAFGSSPFRGSLGGTALNQPIVSAAATPSGQGYWLAAADGGVFTFGDARFFGSAADAEGRVEAIVAAPAGDGYWLIQRDGTVHGFGSAASTQVPVPAGHHVAAADGEGNNLALAVAETPPPPPASPLDLVPAWKIPLFDAIAQCESGGNWSINTGNGYYGGIQFSSGSWRAVGGTGSANQHSRAEQIYRGHLLQERQGWGAWPACTRRLGLR